MVRKRKITRAEAATAKAKLQAFCTQVERWQEMANAALREVPYSLSGHTSKAKVEARAQAAAEQKQLSDGLQQQAADLARLIRDVYVKGFYEHTPEGGRDAALRAIGVYEGIENGGPQPEPPPAPHGAPVAAERDKPSRWTSPFAIVLISAISGALSGLGTSFVGAFYGTKQTCVAGDEKACEPRNGVPYVRLCGPDGQSYGSCMPVSDAPLSPAPAVAPAPSPPP